MKPTVRLNRILPLVAVALVLALLAPRTQRLGYDYRKGGVWKYSTLFAPFDFPVLKTSGQIMEEMSRASAPVLYFRLDESPAASGSRALEESLRPGAFRSLLLPAYRSVMDGGVAADDAIPEGTEVVCIQKGKRAVRKPASDVLSRRGALETILSQVRSAAPELKADSLAAACGLYDQVVPNLVYDAETTLAVSGDAASRVSPTLGYVTAGQLIVSEGEIITEEIAQILDSYRKEYESNVGGSGPAYLEVLGNLLFALMLTAMLALVIWFCNPRIFSDNRYYYIVFVFALSAGSILSIIRFAPGWLCILPMTLSALYLQAFLRERLIVPVYVLSLLPLLVYAEHGASLFVMFLFGGLVSIYACGPLGRGWKQFLLALVNFAVMTAAYTALRLTGAVSGVLVQDIFHLLAASLLAVAGYPLIYLFEKIFNLVSNSRLSELADISSPLLRELEQKAPGTFQHSLQVMNMADAAARAIDANPLLLRVGALYHDIGKMQNPQCFVENESLLRKSEEEKYHRGLSPRQSAEDIIRHVSDGVEIARRHRLPQLVVNFIRTHHGTTVTGYFWGSYLAAKGDPADKPAFTYPGPAPTSKEEIILMLCDSVEAASRTLTEYTPEAFSAFVERIVQGKMDEGQFDGARISIKELGEVKSALKEYLAQMHHGRVTYPSRKKFLNFK